MIKVPYKQLTRDLRVPSTLEIFELNPLYKQTDVLKVTFKDAEPGITVSKRSLNAIYKKNNRPVSYCNDKKELYIGEKEEQD